MVQTTTPTEAQIAAIPLARAGEFQLSPKEVRRTRSRIYSINKDNAAKRRYRTMLADDILMVWRIR